MTKDKLLKNLATNGYNVGFGAKKHFASYDIITKFPYWISFVTLSVGVMQLGYPEFDYNKEVSIGLIITGIASLFLNFFNSDKNQYDLVGIELTQMYNGLRSLYYRVKGSEGTDFEAEEKEMDELVNKFYSKAISRQVFLADWYGHFKFFGEMQVDWVDEQLNFKFFKDKIPNSFKIFVLLIIVIVLIALILQLFGANPPETTEIVSSSKRLLIISIE